jgi:hypothetical protein
VSVILPIALNPSRSTNQTVVGVDLVSTPFAFSRVFQSLGVFGPTFWVSLSATLDGRHAHPILFGQLWGRQTRSTDRLLSGVVQSLQRKGHVFLWNAHNLNV